MINVIGYRRIVLLFIFVSLNVLLGAAVYFYAIPERTASERNLSGLRAQVSTIQSDIDRMEMEFEQLGKQQDAFDRLKESGFFNVQERSHAKEIFKKIQEDSHVISAVANIKSGYTDNNPEALKAKHIILISPVEITIKAFDDADIYRYIDLAEKTFPGYLSLEKIEIQRTKDVSAPVLRAISTGANPELVNAKISMLWKTMIPEPVIATQGGGGG